MSTDPKEIEDLFDAEGFLMDADLWNRDLALSVAAELGLNELTEVHWNIIDEIRKHYLDSGALPVQLHLCHERGLEPHCIKRLFGGQLRAWKIAGLPNPGEEAMSYMLNEQAGPESPRKA